MDLRMLWNSRESSGLYEALPVKEEYFPRFKDTGGLAELPQGITLSTAHLGITDCSSFVLRRCPWCHALVSYLCYTRWI